ncbi:hypothetical protein U9M48_008564 [Paspalum notatum var. saurae]|uniref:Integrase catalytic domain-containing protein n=1 Tax=Paspalum notatum var. saurae TaxID=547442 RepID=A0AAQ3WDM7_PASNO
MRMNLDKCAFGVTAGQFLGFMIHERGIEIGSKSKDAIETMMPPKTKKELHKLIGKNNYVRRFIPNLSAKIEAFMPLIRTQKSEEFIWGPDQQSAFDNLKKYLTTPPMMAPPCLNVPFIVYLSTDEMTISSVLIQEVDGKERVVYYLSRRLLDDETRTLEGLLLKCLGPSEALKVMHDVHEGVCGTHQSAHKMKWLIRRSRYYLPTMLEDCFKYYKGCQECQRFGAVQIAPARPLNPIVKPWLFRGWGMDMIGQVNPPTSKGHKWILVATDYFTKWVEAVPMKNVTAKDVVNFVKAHIIYRFGIPQTITTDQGAVFLAEEFKNFAKEMGITLLQSSPYYAHANGQAKASNKSLIKLIKRKIDEYPKQWHDRLAEALWAYRMSCHGAAKCTPYQLVYGQEAVMPWVVNIGSRRVQFQNDLSADDYTSLMNINTDDLTELRLWVFEKIRDNKARIAKAYNKKVKPKNFKVGDLVWELVLLVGTKDPAFGKWSPNWHGPYRIVETAPDNSYRMETLEGVQFFKNVNGKYLKKYYPSMRIGS